MARRFRGFVLPALLAACVGACGGASEDCPGGCPDGQICFYGTCVPELDGGDHGDGAADADADADDGRLEVRDDADAVEDATAEEFSCDPTAPELCNGLDDNCNGTTDEGFACSPGTVLTCETACGTMGTGTCDESCNPPGPDRCRAAGGDACNGRDDDCDGICDNDAACCAGTIGPCVTACGSAGSAVCSDACVPGTCIPPAETCNGIDDDCDTLCDTPAFGCCRGTTLECTTTCHTTGTRVCGDTCTWSSACTPPVETCNGIDDDCDGVCDDGFACCAGMRTSCTTACGSTGSRTCSPSCTPEGGACTPPAETCNGRDDDCDGACDDGFACCAGTSTTCTTACGSTGTSVCTASCTVGACTPPAEICGNGRDDDCDGQTDESCTTNDTCSSPATLAPGAVATGTTAGAADNSRGTCGSTGGPDVYYRFTLGAASDVFLHSVPSSFDSVLYAGAACGGAELGCNDDIYTAYVQASGLVLRGLAAGTYYVAVDGYAATSAGDFSLTMYATTTGSNGDRCGNPILIPRPGSGTTTSVSGDTCAMSDDATGSCDGGMLGGDEVYVFAVRDRRTVTFSTCNAATTAGTTLYVRGACNDAATELGCNAGAGSTACAANPSAGVLTLTLDPGLYFLYVDSILPFPGMCGAFRVDVTGLF